MKLQEIENFLKIDLQLFGEGDGDTPPVPPTPPTPPTPPENTPTPPTPEDDEDEDEDEDVALLKKRLKVMDGERALELNKIATLESELSETKKMMVEMQNLLLKMAEQPAPKKKVVKISPEEEANIQSKEILLNQMAKLEQQIKDRDEKDFIKTQIADKPYVADAVKKAKIATQNDYIRFIMPLEEDLKEKEELKRKVVTREDADIFTEYGLMGASRGSVDSKVTNAIQQAQSLGASIIDDILR